MLIDMIAIHLKPWLPLTELGGLLLYLLFLPIQESLSVFYLSRLT